MYQEFWIKNVNSWKWVGEIIYLTMYWNCKPNFKKSFCHRIKKLYKSQTGLIQINCTQKCHMTIAENKTQRQQPERRGSGGSGTKFKGTSIKWQLASQKKEWKPEHYRIIFLMLQENNFQDKMKPK